MSVAWGGNKTQDVCENVAVKKENGRVLFYQCRAVLKREKEYRVVQPTPHDIENKLRHTLSLIRITRGLF